MLRFRLAVLDNYNKPSNKASLLNTHDIVMLEFMFWDIKDDFYSVVILI